MATVKQKYPTVRINAETHKAIKQMAEEDSVSMSEVISDAVELYRRKRIARLANEIWAEAMKDPELRREWSEEEAAIEHTFWSPIHDPNCDDPQVKG